MRGGKEDDVVLEQVGGSQIDVVEVEELKLHFPEWFRLHPWRVEASEREQNASPRARGETKSHRRSHDQ